MKLLAVNFVTYLMTIINAFSNPIYNSQSTVVVYTIVIQRTEQRQYQTGSCHSLQCETAACDCAVLDGVM